ncbi:MAG: HepT-like ribonuclease domain-containing protein [Acidiferrobacterales bacterium]
MTLDGFRNHDLVFDAVVRNLEIIGEAAKHLPGEATAMMPDIEWSKVAAFRDVIAQH